MEWHNTNVTGWIVASYDAIAGKKKVSNALLQKS